VFLGLATPLFSGKQSSFINVKTKTYKIIITSAEYLGRLYGGLYGFNVTF